MRKYRPGLPPSRDPLAAVAALIFAAATVTFLLIALAARAAG